MFLAALTFICSNCSFYDDWEKAQRVTPLVNKVLNSKCFADELRDLGVNPRWVDAITTAKRKVPTVFYYANNGTVGYTEPDWSKSVWLNKKFHDGFGLCQTGSNLAHEVLHLEGFRHIGVALNGRQEQLEFPFVYDDGYRVNDAFNACCYQFAD